MRELSKGQSIKSKHFSQVKISSRASNKRNRSVEIRFTIIWKPGFAIIRKQKSLPGRVFALDLKDAAASRLGYR